MFSGLTRDAATARRKAAGTAFGFINAVADLAAHPALVRTTVATPEGPASLVAPPARIDGAIRPLGAVPALGEHGARIRAEFQGRTP
ncbi:hypothetical protein [uncultured Methylobacterium sp.]|uniref:hypothetical protein n=1 Tax=uncultured Methylobacterium sp. TaxID=157278 RepID=UPI0035CB4A16